MDIITSHQIHIRSKDCVEVNSGISSDFHLTLELPITCYTDEMILVSLNSAEIPYTFNDVNKNNNYLEFTEFDYDASSDTYSNPRTTQILNITNGNYTITQLRDAVVNLLNNNSVFSSPYSSSYDTITNKITLAITGANIGCKLLTKTGTNKSKSVLRQLGYNDDKDFSFNSASGAVSDGVVDLATIHSIYVRTDLGLVNTISSNTKNLTDILCKIPINVNPREMIYFEPKNRSGYNLLQQNHIRTFHISITDQNDNIIELGLNINWELTLIFDIVKRPKRIYAPYWDNSDLEEKITITQKPIKRSDVNDLYKEPIRDNITRPVDIENDLRNDDELQDERFKDEINELKDKIEIL